MIAERCGAVSISTERLCMRGYRIGGLRVRKGDRTDRDHLGRGMVRRCGRDHDHGGDAAEARKLQAFDHLFVGHYLVGASLQLAFDALDPERMSESHRFASRPRQKVLPRIGAESERFKVNLIASARGCRYLLQIVSSQASNLSPRSGAPGEQESRCAF